MMIKESIPFTRFELLRIWISLCLIIDWWDQWMGRRDFLYPDSLYTGPFLIGRTSFHPSLYDFLNSAWQCDVLLIVTLLVYCALFLGFYRRISAFISWILFVSLYHRLFPSSYGGDIVLSIFVFSLSFIPKSTSCNFDRLSKIVTRFLHVQMVLIYWLAVFSKTGEQWMNGTAVFWVLESQQFSSEIGYALRNIIPAKFMAYATLVLEFYIPVLSFIPKLRFLVPILIILMHVGFEVLMSIHIFSYVMLGFAILFLPDMLFKKRSKVEGLTTQMYPINNWRFSSPKFAIVVLSSLMFCFALDISNPQPFSAITHVTRKAEHFLGFRQSWEMFSPFVRKDQYWIVTEAKYQSGKVIDIFSKEAPRYDKPYEHISAHKPARWTFAYLSVFYSSEDGKKQLKDFLEIKARELYPDEILSSFKVYYGISEFEKNGDDVLTHTQWVEI